MTAVIDPASDKPWPPPPHLNADLIGQEEAERHLAEAFHGGCFAHAWLISGPQGIGKATLAHRFARYVLAARPAAINDGDGAAGLFDSSDARAAFSNSLFIPPGSPLFRRVAAGGHADFLHVEKTLNDKGTLRSEIVVDDVRRVPAFLSHTSGEGGWRVVVVDNADDMNRNAANALLKVLEEPPARSVLILVSHNPGRLLPTIRSRCRNLVLPPLSGDAVRTLLRRYLSDLSNEEAGVLSRLADGSIGNAVRLAGTGGIDLYDRTLDLLAGGPAVDVVKLHAFADDLASRGKDPLSFTTAMELLRGLLLRLTRFAAAGGSTASGMGPREDAVVDAIAPLATLDRWLQVWENVDGLIERAEAVNLDHKQVVLNVFSEISGAVRR